MNEYGHLLLFFTILTVMIVSFVLIENIYWSSRDESKRNTLKEILVNSSLGFSYKFADFLSLGFYIYFLYDLIKPYGLTIEFAMDWFDYIVLFIVIDFGFYLVHFLMHKVRWFWIGHVTHHSSTRYNFSTALRQNFLVTLNGALLIWWMVPALIGFDKGFVLLVMEINLLYQFCLHTEIPTPKWDKLGWLLNTPSHHRVHHGSNPRQIDCNYAGTLIIWDKLFATFVPEREAGEIKYGLVENTPNTWNPIYLISHELIALIKDVLNERSIKVMFYSSTAQINKNKE